MRILLLTLCFLCHHASADPVSEIMQLAGLDEALTAMPEEFVTGFEQGIRQSGVTDERFMAAVKNAGASVDGGDWQAHTAAALRAGLSKRENRKLLKWYRTPLAQRVTEVELASSNPEHGERTLAMMDSLLTNEPRLALARRIDAAVDATELVMQVSQTTQRAMINGMLQDAPPEQRQQILDQLQTALEEGRPELERYVLASMVATYLSLAEHELEAYVTFLEQPVSRKYNQLVVESMVTALHDMATTLATSLATALSEMKTQS